MVYLNFDHSVEMYITFCNHNSEKHIQSIDFCTFQGTNLREFYIHFTYEDETVMLEVISDDFDFTTEKMMRLPPNVKSLLNACREGDQSFTKFIKEVIDCDLITNGTKFGAELFKAIDWYIKINNEFEGVIPAGFFFDC